LIRLKQCLAEFIESKEKRHVVVFSAIQRKAAIYVAETGAIPKHWYLKEDGIFQLW
jgi:hypothetical protein